MKNLKKFLLTVLLILLLMLQQILAQNWNISKLDSVKALLIEKKYDEPINVLNNILIDDSTNVNAYYYLSACYRAVSNYQKAANVLSKALLYKHNDVKIMLSLGNDLFASGRISDSKKILLHAFALDSTNSSVLISLGKILIQQHDWIKARKVYNSLIRNDSANSYYFEQAAKCNLQLNNADDAIIDFQIAHRLNPMNEQTILELSSLYLKNSQPLSAMRIINDGLAYYPSSAEIWKIKGKIFLSMKEYENAIASYKSSIMFGDSSQTNFKDIGICNYFLEGYDSAIVYLNIAIKIEKDATSFFYLGASYKELKNYDEAIANLSAAADLLKNDFTAEVYTQLGSTYYLIKNYKEALNSYKEALREKPEKRELNFYLAVVYEHYYKDKSIAMNYYKKFLADSAKADKKLVNYAEERLSTLTEDNFMNIK